MWKFHGLFESAILNFFSKNIFFCFIPMKIRQSFMVSKDGSKFWSRQTWKYFLTQTKHYAPECRNKSQLKMWEQYFYLFKGTFKFSKFLMSFRTKWCQFMIKCNICHHHRVSWPFKGFSKHHRYLVCILESVRLSSFDLGRGVED